MASTSGTFQFPVVPLGTLALSLTLASGRQITGFSAEVGPEGLDDGQHAEIHWSVQGRGGGLSSLRSQLEGFHGWVVGTIAPDGAFESLSFSPVRNVT